MRCSSARSARCGRSLWAQALLGALLVPAVGRAGALAFGRRAGSGRGGGTAFWPELVWFSTHFWSETVFLVLLWWAIERSLAADARGSTRAAALAGLLWGLDRPHARAGALPRAARRPVDAAAVERGRETAGVRGRPSAGSIVPSGRPGLATVLTIAPWTVRNALVFRAFIPVSTMGGLDLWQGNTTLGHLQIYEVLARIGSPVEQDRYCRRMAWETIAARQPTWVFEKLAEQMPEFWKPGSEVLDHYGGREACGPLPAARLASLELLLVPPYLAALGLFVVGLARVRLCGGAGLLLLVLAAYNAAHVVSYATTRFRLPVTPVVFMVAAAAVVGWRDGSLVPLRGWRWVAARGARARRARQRGARPGRAAQLAAPDRPPGLSPGVQPRAR